MSHWRNNALHIEMTILDFESSSNRPVLWVFLNPLHTRTCIASTEHIKSVVKLYLCNSSRVRGGSEGVKGGRHRWWKEREKRERQWMGWSFIGPETDRQDFESTFSPSFLRFPQPITHACRYCAHRAHKEHCKTVSLQQRQQSEGREGGRHRWWKERERQWMGWSFIGPETDKRHGREGDGRDLVCTGVKCNIGWRSRTRRAGGTWQ